MTFFSEAPSHYLSRIEQTTNKSLLCREFFCFHLQFQITLPFKCYKKKLSISFKREFHIELRFSSCYPGVMANEGTIVFGISVFDLSHFRFCNNVIICLLCFRQTQ